MAFLLFSSRLSLREDKDQGVTRGVGWGRATSDRQDDPVNDRRAWPGVRGHAGGTGTDTNTIRAWRDEQGRAALSFYFFFRFFLLSPLSSVLGVGVRATSMYTITSTVISRGGFSVLAPSG